MSTDPAWRHARARSPRGCGCQSQLAPGLRERVLDRKRHARQRPILGYARVVVWRADDRVQPRVDRLNRAQGGLSHLACATAAAASRGWPARRPSAATTRWRWRSHGAAVTCCTSATARATSGICGRAASASRTRAATAVRPRTRRCAPRCPTTRARLSCARAARISRRTTAPTTRTSCATWRAGRRRCWRTPATRSAAQHRRHLSRRRDGAVRRRRPGVVPTDTRDPRQAAISSRSLCISDG
jgi:hypothetical protein